MSIRSYRSPRIEVLRPFIHVDGDEETEDIAAYALSRGLELKLLEIWDGDAWIRDSVYKVAEAAIFYYKSMGTPAPADVIIRQIAGTTSTLDDAQITTVGEIAGYPQTSKSEIAYLLDTLTGQRVLGDYREATRSIDAQLSAGEINSVSALDTMMATLRETRRWAHRSKTVREGKTAYSVKEEVAKLVYDLGGDETEHPLPLGITKFDKLSRGLRVGDLLIVGAQPNTGKTWLLNHIAVNAARNGKVAVFASVS